MIPSTVSEKNNSYLKSKAIGCIFVACICNVRDGLKEQAIKTEILLYTMSLVCHGLPMKKMPMR